MFNDFFRKGATMIRAVYYCVLAGALSTCCVLADASSDAPDGSILYSSIGPRGWDVYVIDAESNQPRQLTDHPALDYNAAIRPDGEVIAFVSERDGIPNLYTIRRDGTELTRLTNSFSLDDHPTWSPDGKRIAFSSTRQPADRVGQAWNAIYVMNADGTDVQRVSPPGLTDYSPAWSADGEWLACASGRGDPGGTTLWIMKPDGSNRKQIAENAGWPTFSSDSRWLYFHRKSEGENDWAIWRVALDGTKEKKISGDGSSVMTPASDAAEDQLIAISPVSGKRHIVKIAYDTGTQTQLTERQIDHWNPSMARGHVVYHCATPGFSPPNVEVWKSPPGFKFQMLRLGGAFPAVSPDGKRLALTGGNFARVDVMNFDGSNRKVLFESQPRHVFSLSWSSGQSGPDRVAFSHGKSFQGANSIVDVETIAPDGSNHASLTKDQGNNAFPSYSPDGSQMVFRSGRDGNKNLYIMNVDGSDVRRLTQGEWTDTMANWSPTGEWIAFSSDRDKNFEIYLIKPDGTDLRKLVGGNVRHNHPHFSPDGKWIVFTSQRAGFSAETVSLPRQPQAYGDLFAVRLDGTGLARLTHNGFEEGTPEWSHARIASPSSDSKPSEPHEF